MTIKLYQLYVKTANQPLILLRVLASTLLEAKAQARAEGYKVLNISGWGTGFCEKINIPYIIGEYVTTK